MDDFLQLVASRQSDRAYDMSRAVEHDKLERILEAARLSPSACNAQPWRFVVVTDPELAVKVGKATAGLGMNKFAKDAPVHILVVEESMNITSFLGAKIKDKYFPLIDIGIAAAHITLAAESEGLGSCLPTCMWSIQTHRRDKVCFLSLVTDGYTSLLHSQHRTQALSGDSPHPVKVLLCNLVITFPDNFQFFF